ncbi:SDR family NAD(P)-dependent oxidoreductase [Aeromonas veronii]|uniref:SDR family NAD(P)-dependent oxidoreductase n=1 Tax=Aeromonas veronii TaxID=654 RepID=UPI003C6EC50E
MSGLLQGKKVLVTGAGRGIGLAIARQFAAQGAALWLNGRDDVEIARVAEALHADFGVSCLPLCFDVAEPKAVKQAFQRLFTETRQLDVLVNNAGILDDALIGMVQQQQIERTFSTNSYSTLYCSQYAARLMQRAGGGQCHQHDIDYWSGGKFGPSCLCRQQGGSDRYYPVTGQGAGCQPDPGQCHCPGFY